MRQVRCPKCHGMAGPSKTPDGQDVLRCNGCGTMFKLRRM